MVLFSGSISFEEEYSSSWGNLNEDDDDIDKDNYPSSSPASQRRKSLKLVQDRMKVALRPLQENKGRRRRKYNKNYNTSSTRTLRQKRQAQYEEQIEKKGNGFWSFESLFPSPVYDSSQVKKDLYGIAERDTKLRSKKLQQSDKDVINSSPKNKMPAAALQFSTTATLPAEANTSQRSSVTKRVWEKGTTDEASSTVAVSSPDAVSSTDAVSPSPPLIGGKVNQEMTKRVESALSGIRKVVRYNGEDYEYYDNSSEDGVQYRDGVRLGSALKINADVLTYHARRELRYNNLEESRNLYKKALEIDPRDGRTYLGLSRIAQKRKDYRLARKWLQDGIKESVSVHPTTGQPDWGGNPYILQALGCFEEKMGYLGKAEQYLIKAIRSRPSHAPAYVALVQLRTRKFRQTAQVGRRLFMKCEEELKKAGMEPNAFVYTSWAALEYKKEGNVQRARMLFQKAIEIDPRCSSAWLQWGVMEAANAPDDDNEETNNRNMNNYEQAEYCYRSALRHDPKNSRVLQAYAILETKRGNTRNAINLFERALKSKPRDAGVLQAYALFVSDLGDYESARALLEKGTRVNKRHAPLWQAWGVLELRRKNYDEARDIFQQGIWNCSQPSGTQSGGYACARLWQAWGVLEFKTGDIAAARQCFHRALDADPRNAATFTAWTILEEMEGQTKDARAIYERALKQFPASSDEKLSLWRSYELMEQREGNSNRAQLVYQRSMRETMVQNNNDYKKPTTSPPTTKEVTTRKPGEVYVMDDGTIESKVPESVMNKKKKI